MSGGDRTWWNPHTLAALVGLAVVAAVFWASRDYPSFAWEMGGPPGFYPRFLAALLGALCVAVFVEGLLHPAPVTFPSGRGALTMAGAVVLLGVSPWLLEWLGFRIAGTLFLVVAMLLLGERGRFRPRRLAGLLVIAVAATAVLYLVFERAARTPLPRGTLFE